ncbi:hypothetical protein D3C87_1479870 [compost metagenome]
MVSSFISFFVAFKNVGTRKIPPINHNTKKKPSFKIDSSIIAPSNCWLTASVVSNTSNKMATRSSTIRTPNTSPANFLCFTPSSSNALMIMVVDETERIPPRNILSMVDQPITLPATKPISSINTTSTMAVIEAEPPTFTSFLKLNSRPRLKSKKITPISAQMSILFLSTTVGKKWMCGPTSKPARI